MIKAGIETAPVVPGRLEAVPCKRGFDVVVDYAHTPHALETVLHSLKNLVKGRILLVFGCGGDRDKEKRPMMGKVADENSDIFWLTNDNPRSEDPLKHNRRHQGRNKARTNILYSNKQTCSNRGSHCRGKE